MSMMSPGTAGMRKVQATSNRLAAQQAQVVPQTGKILIVSQSGSDESTVEINFTYPFIEQPIFTFGAALANGQGYKAGALPTVSALVTKWLYVDGANPVYTGAQLGIHTTNDPAAAGMKIFLHFMFTGQATQYPAGAQPSNTTGTA
jgi:hypothetical protein